MAGRGNTGHPAQGWRESGGLLLQVGGWLLSVVGGFLLPPPVGVAEGRGRVLVALGRFGVAILVGLWIWPTQRWDSKRHAKWWSLTTVMLLGASLWLVVAYQGEREARTCIYLGRPVLMGSQLTEAAARVMREEPESNCAKLLADFGSDPEQVWTRQSIASARRGLQLLYLGGLAVASMTMLSVIQVGYCLRPRASSSP